nr:immunoglobulin heavy chain junction region [Mus musculus]
CAWEYCYGTIYYFDYW